LDYPDQLAQEVAYKRQIEYESPGENIYQHGAQQGKANRQAHTPGEACYQVEVYQAPWMVQKIYIFGYFGSFQGVRDPLYSVLKTSQSALLATFPMLPALCFHIRYLSRPV
jgi:hypothetical protein